MNFILKHDKTFAPNWGSAIPGLGATEKTPIYVFFGFFVAKIFHLPPIQNPQS